MRQPSPGAGSRASGPAPRRRARHRAVRPHARRRAGRLLLAVLSLAAVTVLIGAGAGVALGTAFGAAGPGPATTSGIPDDLAMMPALPAATVAPVGPPPAPVAIQPPAPVPTPAPAPSQSQSAAPTLAPAPAFEPHPDDVEPEAKRLAGRFVQALMTYGPSATPRTVATTATAAHGGDAAAVVEAAAGLVHADTQSVGSIVYPQLGGLTASRTSVMVVARQELLTADGASRVETRTLDVRLRRVDGRWRVDRLASDGGPVADRPAALPAAAVRVLDHPALELPDSARWDIYRGAVDPRLLELLADVADRREIAVAVLITGHPWEVFGTDRMSRHTAGRAFDIWRIDGELVASGRTVGSPTYELTRWLFDAGVPELGSPWSFDPRGGRSFTDAVHQDHLHVAIRG